MFVKEIFKTKTGINWSAVTSIFNAAKIFFLLKNHISLRVKY